METVTVELSISKPGGMPDEYAAAIVEGFAAIAPYLPVVAQTLMSGAGRVQTISKPRAGVRDGAAVLQLDVQIAPR